MAQTSIAFIFETDRIADAADTCLRIHEALARRHGQRFRDLERRLEALPDLDDWGEIELASIEWGRFVMTVPPVLTAIIQEARDLGVIP